MPDLMVSVTPAPRSTAPRNSQMEATTTAWRSVRALAPTLVANALATSFALPVVGWRGQDQHRKQPWGGLATPRGAADGGLELGMPGRRAGRQLGAASWCNGPRGPHAPICTTHPMPQPIEKARKMPQTKTVALCRGVQKDGRQKNRSLLHCALPAVPQSNPRIPNPLAHSLHVTWSHMVHGAVPPAC